MTKPMDVTGLRFGRLVVMGRQGSDKRGSALWRCLCDCGAVVIVASVPLRSGATKSCGCLRKDTIGSLNRSHMMTKTPTWNSWRAMVERCTNPNNIGWHLYGGRGITVCDSWRDFANFLADMGERPKRKFLDRIDPNLGYTPGNVRWATQKEQQRNRRNNRLLTFNGKTQPMMAWADETKLPRTCIERRIRRGWSVERALTQPRSRG